MGWRWMFWFTGLPGWMRFGYSPGWGGLPPGAAYFWPSLGAWPRPWWPWGAPSREEELAWLEAQARILEAQLKAIKDQLEELTKEGR